MAGPLGGIRIVELAGQGPGPFACMLLADLGADVVTVERIGARRHTDDAHARGRRSVALNLKDKRAADLVLDLVAESHAVVEGFRPGVVERLGLGPSECLERNPGLVYGRVTGWGQEGPLASSAGHDINYLAVSGALHAIGERGRPPVAPLNLLGDYGAAGMLLALGVVSALLESSSSGQGQVVDAAMVDGLAAMLAPFHAAAARGSWRLERGSNLLDGAAPFYGVYRTSDDRYLSVGAIEPAFYSELLALLGLDPADLGPQLDKAGWDAARASLAEVFSTRTRSEWVAHFADHDACVAPVLDLAEARQHPHAVSRGMFADRNGIPHPAPAPRFSRTGLAWPRDPEAAGTSTDDVLVALGVRPDQISQLREAGVVA
ncbi:MAG: CaiB/BaiF CoA transferase family protein [Mycobacteriales bacterium]